MTDLKQTILDTFTTSNYRQYFEQETGADLGAMNSSGYVLTNCVWHQDENPSLNINLLAEGSYNCFSCGAKGDIWKWHQEKHSCDFKGALSYFADFLNIDIKQLKKSSSTKPKVKKKLGKPVATYSYYNLDGNEVCQTVRYENPKEFRQRRPHPTKKDEYIWNLSGVEVVPYNLPDFKKSDIIYFVEGEKDADRLKQIGLVGTTAPMGAGKWFDNVNQHFKGKKVVILPDNDDPGHSHAELVAKNLHGITDSIQIVKLPNLKPEGDISDWLSVGNTKADLLEVVKDGEPYESHIDWLNKRHAQVMISGKSVILNEEYDPIFDRPDISFSSIQNFRDRYLSYRIPNPLAGQKGQPKTITIASDWLKSTDHLQYDRIIFSPSGNCPDKCYNLWKGFAVEPKRGDWSKFKDHVYKVISSEKDYIFNWIMAWMAWIVQNPGGERPGSALVLRGEQGVGKGIFVSGFGQIFGNHYLQINNQNQLTSRFNNHLKNVLLLFIDEGFWAGDKSAEGVIRGIVTEDILPIESKGKDIVVFKNHLYLSISSNHEWLVPAGPDERRFFVIDISSIRKGDKPYFNKIIKELKNGGVEAMLFDLLKYEVKIDYLKDFPRTSALLDQIVESMSPVHKFWFEKLRAGHLLPFDTKWTGLIQAEKLYDQYVEFCDTIGERRKKIDKQFGKELRKICKGLDRVYLKTMVDEAENYAHKWHYEFPNLEKCRIFFEKMVQIEIDWDTGEVFVNDEFSAI